MVTHLTPGEHLAHLIDYLAFNTCPDPTNDEPTLRAHARAVGLLHRVAPETMSQRDVASRWPRVLAHMMVESGGYFTPASAANALLAYRIGRPFGCEYYCMLAGFERDGTPRDWDEYNRKLKEAGKRQIVRATQCRCLEVRLDGVHGWGRHQGSGSRSIGSSGSYEYALALVRQFAGGADQHAMLAGWF